MNIQRNHRTSFAERVEIGRKSLSMTTADIAREHQLSTRRIRQIVNRPEVVKAIQAFQAAHIDSEARQHEIRLQHGGA